MFHVNKGVGYTTVLFDLRTESGLMDWQDVVEWHCNASFDELHNLLAGAVGAIHTMLDEHFGISIVECMAAGGSGDLLS